MRQLLPKLQIILLSTSVTTASQPMDVEGTFPGPGATAPTAQVPVTIKMNQPALAKRIVDSLGLKDQRMHDVPAEPNARLTKDEDGPERKDEFHCRSSIGQLNHLTASTRPEIQFCRLRQHPQRLTLREGRHHRQRWRRRPLPNG